MNKLIQTPVTPAPKPSLSRDFVSGKFAATPTAVTLGNFDGVHRGHQAMIQVVIKAARERQLKPALMTFAPAPGAFFAKRTNREPPARLQRTRDKLICIWAIGIEHIQLARFNDAMAKLSPDAFCDRWLRDALNAKWVIVGEDFRYGHQREGDIKTLHAWCKANGVECYVMPTVKAMDIRSSSSLVRAALAKGECAIASAILSRPYRISGKVTHGDKIGRTLDFPTINIPMWTPLPLQGIFAVRVYGVDLASGEPMIGAANVGTRPTVTDSGRALLEVFLLDYPKENGELYGRRVVVEFVERIRKEEKFESMDLMMAQMHRDVETVRRVFAHRGRY